LGCYSQLWASATCAAYPTIYQSDLGYYRTGYKKTPIFTEKSLPTGLKNDHSTKAGVWAKIVVIEGKLRYRVDTLGIDVELSLDKSGIVVPEMLHSVEPLGTVKFFVEFYKEPDHFT